eukprot:4056453-Lingulodinium_polyedra.AAC.1
MEIAEAEVQVLHDRARQVPAGLEQIEIAKRLAGARSSCSRLLTAASRAPRTRSTHNTLNL